MVARRKKKYSSGEAKQFISRRAALRKLQLTLQDFRRICILKGIYPREPNKRKRAQKGNTEIKTLYHLRDIQFLLHEPLIWKLRDNKVFFRRLARAKALRDTKEFRRQMEKNRPVLKLDKLVKERYPTFLDAIRDLDDCLTLCFLFSTFPSLVHVDRSQSEMCRRLTIEFLHAVIEAKALRKVFVSIKGYYFQAELKGEKITWIVPHHFSFEPQAKKDVDFKLMSTFVEFYVVMLGFINFRLYHTMNMIYPPTFSANDTTYEDEQSLIDEESFVSERVAALNCPIARRGIGGEEEVPLDVFNVDDNEDKVKEMRKELESVETLKTLFKGLKFFLNREVPREPLVFVIRCFGGEVSWDNTLFVGSSFEETDETITHQIVDRPSMDEQYISRYYVQPQWVFDCVNLRKLLPVASYLIGEALPPHLSPFVDKDRTETYIPPEEKALYDQDLLEKMFQKDKNGDNVDDAADDKVSDEDSKEDEEDDEEEDEEEDDDDDGKVGEKRRKPKLSVKPGEVFKEAPGKEKEEDHMAYKLREKMIKKKHRKMYKSMMDERRGKNKETWLLKKKRTRIEESEKIKRKEKARAAGKFVKVNK